MINLPQLFVRKEAVTRNRMGVFCESNVDLPKWFYNNRTHLLITKEDLQDTSFAYDHCIATFVVGAACRSSKIVCDFHHLTLTVGTACLGVLKHVSKCYDIFRVVYDCRKVVVGMI